MNTSAIYNTPPDIFAFICYLLYQCLVFERPKFKGMIDVASRTTNGVKILENRRKLSCICRTQLAAFVQGTMLAQRKSPKGSYDKKDIKAVATAFR